MHTTRPDGLSSSLPFMRVLILEDNPRDAKLMASALEGGGLRVRSEVTDSIEFFRQRLVKTEYDVILAEFNLRGWTALDALDVLKRSGKDIPLIVVTGSLGDESAVECIKQGAADFVLKDRPARLPTAVQRALEDKRLRAENQRAFEAISRLATIVESSGDAIIGKTLEGVVTSWNKGAEMLYGYSADEVLGQPIAVLAPPDRLEEMAQILVRLKQGERAEHYETVRVRKDGTLVDVSLSIFPLVGSHGAAIGAASIARDITQRKRAEEALQNEKAFTQSVIDGLPDGFYVIDSTGRFVRWNKNAGKTLGYSSEELAAMDPLAIVAEDERSLAARKMQEAMAKGSATTEVHLLAKEGRKIPYILTATRSVIADKVYLVGVAVDITERKRAENALRESERKYRRLYESMIDGFVRVNMDGRITEANDAFCKMLGYSPEELSKFPYQDLIPEKWHVVETCVIEQEVLTRGYSEIYFKAYQRKDGAIIPVEVRKYLMLDESGDACGMWAIVRDITEHKWAEEMLREYEKVVEGSDEMIAVIDREYGIILANHAYLDHVGLEREELVGSSLPEVLGEEFFARVVKEKVDECFHGNVVRFEEKYQDPKLGERDILASYFPIEGDHSVDRAGVILQDVTERKRAEEIQSWLASFPTLNPTPIVEVGPAGSVEYLNPVAERLFPGLRQTGLGHPWLTGHGELEQACRASGTNMFIREVCVGEVWYQQIVHYVPATQRLRIYGFDITERKQAEKALAESQALTKAIFESTSDMIWSVDSEEL